MTETVILALITFAFACVLLFSTYVIVKLVLKNNPSKLFIKTAYIRIDTEFEKSR